MSVVGKNLGMRMCEWIADARKGVESRDGQQPEVACSACCASFDILQQLRPSDGSKLGALSLLRNRSPEKRSMSDRPNGTTMREHWDSVFQARPDPFGSEPSDSAKVAAQAFARASGRSGYQLRHRAGHAVLCRARYARRRVGFLRDSARRVARQSTIVRGITTHSNRAARRP